MGDSSEPLPLAPLSIGEIFDRAVTIWTRIAAAFSVSSLAGILPPNA